MGSMSALACPHSRKTRPCSPRTVCPHSPSKFRRAVDRNRPQVKARSPLNVDPIGEHREFHRLVFDGPTLNNPVGSPSAACCQSNEMDGRWIFPKPRLMVRIATLLVLSAA